MAKVPSGVLFSACGRKSKCTLEKGPVQFDFTSHTSSCVPPPPGAPAHQAHSHQEIRSSRFLIPEWSTFAPGLCVAGSSSSLRWLFTHYLLWETFLIILSRLDLACPTPRRLHHCPRSFFFSHSIYLALTLFC